MKPFYISVALVAFTLVNPAFSADKKDVYARYLPIEQGKNLYGLIPLDHTYACEKNDGKEKCYSRSGGNSGGNKLEDTSSKERNTNVKCVYDEGKAGGACDMHPERTFYMREGSCHQETNHALRTGAKSGPTVHNAKGYGISSAYWGRYGNSTVAATCKAVCNK